MDQQDLGYDPKTGRHAATLTMMEARFLHLFWGIHEGRDNAISGNALGACLFYAIERGQYFPARSREGLGKFMKRRHPGRLEEYKRMARHLQNHLVIVHENIPLYSRPGNNGGYWLSSDEEEAEAFYRTFRKNGMTSLIKASRGKRRVLAGLVKQLTFEFDRQFAAFPAGAGVSGPSAPVTVVDAFLEEMTRNPEQHADALAALGRKYSGVFLPKERADEIRQTTAKLQQMLAEIG